MQWEVTALRKYSVRGSLDSATLAGYPLDTDPSDTWKPRRWDEQATNEEVEALMGFLSEQRRQWTESGKNPGEVKELDAIIRDLSSWLDTSVQHTARISYKYSGAQPGTAAFVPANDWLYFYYLSSDRTTITEINNAFR